MSIDLLTRIDRSLRGAATLQELGTWLLETLTGILASGDVQAVALPNQLDADLTDLRETLLEADTVRARLARELQEARAAGVATVTVSLSSFLRPLTAGATLRTGRSATRFLYAPPRPAPGDPDPAALGQLGGHAKLRLFLAHFAEVRDSMLYALGGGWSESAPSCPRSRSLASSRCPGMLHHAAGGARPRPAAVPARARRRRACRHRR